MFVKAIGAERRDLAHDWYDRMLQNLREENYADAAHAAGVLSHYFVDPLQPLHTMQCARGRVIHRPLEWSVCQTYDEILRLLIESDMRVVFELSHRRGWLGEAILHGARYASRQYNQIVQEYRPERRSRISTGWIKRSPAHTLAGLFGVSITGWARVLERAAGDAESIRRKSLPDAYVASSCVTAVLADPDPEMAYRLETKTGTRRNRSVGRRVSATRQD